MQSGTHQNVPKSVRYLLHSADFVEKRNTTVTFSDCLLRLSCDKRAEIFKKNLYFFCKTASEPLDVCMVL